MMRRYLYAASFAVAAVMVSSPAAAWGDAGHRLIVSLATPMLTPAARAGVDDLLASEALLATPYCPVTTLSDASVWADCARTRYKERFSAMSAWHYVNIEICAPFTLAGCVDDQCVTGALRRQLAVLGDRRQPRALRVMALNWVAHLTADLHQPLHVGDHGDRGGNQVTVIFGDRQSRYGQNLHGIWDRDLAEIAIGSMPVWRSEARYQLPSGVNPTGQGSIEDWARESWQLSRTVAYFPLLAGQPCGTPIAPVIIDDSYVRQAVPVIQLQLQCAGVRLATLLNGALR